MAVNMTAEDVIRLLELEPHPEGGCYREMFRDEKVVQGRAASTAIYFLLEMGQRSRWHRVDAAEVWHWYAGTALRLQTWRHGGAIQSVRLGTNLRTGERPQAVVIAGEWQSAEPLGAWSLVGCTVAPGFEFSGFELAPEGWEPGS